MNFDEDYPYSSAAYHIYGKEDRLRQSAYPTKGVVLAQKKMLTKEIINL